MTTLPERNTRILIVQDEPAAAARLAADLKELGHTVCGTVASGWQAVAQAAELLPELALVDLGCDDATGEATEHLVGRCHVPVLYLVGDAPDSVLERAAMSEPAGYLVKPFTAGQLGLQIAAACTMSGRNRRLQRSVARLRRHNDLMSAAFDSIEDGVVAADTDGRILLTNASAERVFGTVPAPQPRWPEAYGLFHADGTTRMQPDEVPLVRAMRGVHAKDFKMVVRNRQHPDGIVTTVRMRPLGNKAGIGGGVVVIRDVTRISASEDNLRATVADLGRSTRLMDAVFANIDDGVVACDPDGNYLIFNRSAERIIGTYLPDAAIEHRSERYGLYYPDGVTLMPPEQLPLTRALRHGEATDNVDLAVYNEHRPNGVRIRVSGRPLVDRAGHNLGGVIVFRDVTALVRTEGELRRTTSELQTQRRTMQTIFDSISDGVIVADRAGRITMYNPSAERIFGTKPGTLPIERWPLQYGCYLEDGTTPMPADQLPLVRAIRGESTDDVAVFVRNESVPEGVHVRASGRPLEHGRSGGVVVYRDVTERVRTEEALMQAFSQGRMEVLDTILHNIGNAINSVAVGTGTIREELKEDQPSRGLHALAQAVAAHGDDWIDYLQNDPQGRQVRPFISSLAEQFSTQHDRVQRAVDRVAGRVAHIVDIIRTQRSLSGPAPLFKDVDLRQTVIDSVRVLQESLTRRAIELQVDCGSTPVSVRIQESRFHQMLVNLVKNAIEAIDEQGRTQEGFVRIAAHVKGGTLHLEVTDSGIGLEPERLRTIFSPGYTTKAGGSGLGLHSAANYVIGSGGTIEALSTGIGRGTTMRIGLRLPPSPS
ncbi:MAG: PAS domain-containing protein [Spirochaetaceae bacterium]|nr:PAS domain-containing protein [Spirochaetaceae bacterium]